MSVITIKGNIIAQAKTQWMYEALFKLRFKLINAISEANLQNGLVGLKYHEI